MIPVQLTVKGLYSYKEAQTIDFETPISAGLFGIFGGVGSGKSSLLEAILFVLYDRTDRLNKAGDNRYYNMLNLQSNELIIDFIFYAGDNHKKKYRFYFKAARKKQNFEKVEVKDRSYYQWRNQKWQPLENIRDASDLLGMNYDNFKQTVIIPQGKFREFIDQKPGARTQMLKELFHLEQFDLSAATGTLLNQARLELSRTEGRLEELGPIADDAVIKVEKQLVALRKSIDEKEKQQQNLEIEEAQHQELKVLFEKIIDISERLAVLQNDQELFQQKERQLTKYEKANTIFKEKLNQFFGLLEEMKKAKEQIAAQTTSIKEHEERLLLAEKDFTKVSKEWENKDVIQRTCEDLRLLMNIKNSQVQLDASKRKIEKMDTRLSRKKEICAGYKKEKSALESKVLDQDQIELTELHLVNRWWERQNEINAILDKLKVQLLQVRKELDKVSKRRKSLLAKLPVRHRQESEQAIKQYLKTTKEKLDNQIKDLSKQRNELQVKQELSHYSKTIEEGQPCPLCGATHHPSMVKFHSVQDEIDKKTSAISQLEEEKSTWLEWQQVYQQVSMEIASIEQLQQQHLQQRNDTTHQKELHQQAFQWKNYADLEFSQVQRILEKAIAEQKEIETNKRRLGQLREKLNIAESKLLKDQDAWQILNQEVLQIEATINANKSILKILPYSKYHSHQQEQLQKSLKNGEQQLDEIDKKFKQSDKLINELRSELDRRKGHLQGEEKSWQAIELKANKVDTEIKSLVKEHKFENVRSVQKILSLNLNIAQERKDIENFGQELFAIENSLMGLQREAGKRKYNEEKHMNLLHEIKILEEEKQNQKDLFAIKNQEGSQLKVKLSQLKELHKTQERLSIRKDHLQLLAQLFKGQGFVNYVSTIYLQNLCELANQRFFKLTQNNLSLELNENNEFIIRDYLNDGKTRLLKTLSGGQTFQAALCLALALAENVKSLSQSERSFFFLDEGFGSLDKASLRVVFETLKSLRKENRIVGIISHVEELQQEVDIYLQIDHDKERGSLVKYSWQ